MKGHFGACDPPFSVRIKRVSVSQRHRDRNKNIAEARPGQKMPGSHTSRKPDLPVEVILHILSQVYVEENEVVHMASRERGLQALRSQLAAPFLYAQDCVVDDFRCCFNMLQDTLQGHILTGNSCFHGLAMKCRVSLHKIPLSITEERVTYEELTALYSINT